MLLALVGAAEAFSGAAPLRAVRTPAASLVRTPATVDMGRGDKRTTKGKRTAHSFGNARPNNGELRRRRNGPGLDSSAPAVEEVVAAAPEPGSFFEGSTSGAATGAKIEEEDKTDGIPNYMLRDAGTISRLSESLDSSFAVQDDGVLYEADRLVSIVTTDVIEMVQQQGGAAEKVDHVGENILVEGLLFDSFMVDDTFDIADSADGDDVVTLQIIEHRTPEALELGQLGDDDGKKQSILSFGSIAGFSGWTARVVTGGRVRSGFKIAKRAT